MARVTPQTIKVLADSLQPRFHHFEGTTTTVCALFLPNGFQVGLGTSNCVVPANFDAELGKKLSHQDAMANAIDKLWELEGYRLKCEIEDE